jgi:GNAT superfamily N-acetyltransferase
MLASKSRTVCSIRILQEGDIRDLDQQFAGFSLRENSEELYRQQVLGLRENWVAIHQDKIVGIVSLSWVSDYEPFSQEHIPEICTICVLPDHRRKGIATALLNRVEPIALKKARQIGISLNLAPCCNFSQRMYVKRGYIPDGNGLFYQKQPLTPQQQICIDDDLCMYLIKKRSTGLMN